MKDIIEKHLKDAIEVKEKMISGLIPQVIETVNLIIDSLKSGGKVILFGNGGSAADAQHIAAELVSKFEKDRAPLAGLALTTNTSVLSSIGNDYGYEHIFSRQVELWAQEKDVVVAISTSGTSPNIIKAIEAANKKDIKTVGMTGANGDTLCSMTQICIKVPSTSTPRIQEAHITIGHIISYLVEKNMFPDSDA